MTASLWNPHVEGQQHSACRLKIQKGSDILQVGWRVSLIARSLVLWYLNYFFNLFCDSFFAF